MPGVDVLSAEASSSLLFPHLVDAAAFMEDEGKLLAQHRKPPSLHSHGLLPHSLHPQHSLQHQHLQHHHAHQHAHHPQHQQQQHQQHQQHQQLPQHQHHPQHQQQLPQHQQQQQQQQQHPHQQHPQHQQHQQHQSHQHQQHQQHAHQQHQQLPQHQQHPQHTQHPQHSQHSLSADHNFLAVCAERDALIMQRDTAVAEKEAACAERDAAILQRDTVINEYKVVVAALDSLKAEREAALQGRKRYPDVAAEGSKLLQVATVNMPDNCSFSDDYDLLSHRSGQIGMGMGLDVDATAKPAKQAPAKEAGKKHPRTSTPSKKAAAGGAAGQAPKRRKSPAKKPGQWQVQDGQEFPDGVKLEEGAEATEGTVPPPPPKTNGRPHYDSATTPIPYCSCTGVTQQCYRWGNGGWQSACCTNLMSQYPLPMNPKKRGSRLAGRKMSAGAFEKLLEKLATEGVNINYPVDLKDHWAKHGTNRYVTLK